MCLTGVDDLSTLGYQPGIAALAAGLLSPSPPSCRHRHPGGRTARLPAGRRGKPARRGLDRDAGTAAHLLEGQAVRPLTLLGFAATDFLITITLSAADASTHLVESPT